MLGKRFQQFVTTKFAQPHYFLSQKVGGYKRYYAPLSKSWGDMCPRPLLKLGPCPQLLVLCLPRAGPKGKIDVSVNPLEKLVLVDGNNINNEYVLKSAVVHVGSSTDSSHYAAYVVEDKAVVEYNDECVSLISIAEEIKKIVKRWLLILLQ